MSIDLAQFIPTFLEESYEGLELFESCLLQLGEGEAETINAIFRAVHSIKGGAGTFGFTRIAEFTHTVETLLDEMRDGRRAVTPEGVNLLLQAGDCIRTLLDGVRGDAPADEARIAQVQAALESLLADAPAADSVGAGDSVPVSAPQGWQIHFQPHPHLLSTGNEPLFMFQALAELGTLEVTADLSRLPPLSELDPEECHLAWQLTLRGAVSEAAVREVFEWVEDDCELAITPLAELPPPTPNAAEPPGTQLAVSETVASQQIPPEPQAAVPAPSSTATSQASPPAATSIRVSIDKVDALLNRVGELVITQSMLGQISSELSARGYGDNEWLEKLQAGLAQLERNTRELREDVMRVRMLPISVVFNRFPRLVHDLSGQLGKQVQLRLAGEHTELDKTVMEKIGDPLVHLVRNAIDHGLETPAEREACGKPATGTVQLNAYHQGGHIIIEISDDGRGLDKARILHKARERGLLAEGENLRDEEVYELIFRPGFSTAAEVSDISGRGVGMDVVRRNIQALGGAIEVQSTPGAGSTFRISLPLTLAILEGQLVRIGRQTYVIPLLSIIESVQLDSDALQAIAGEQRLYRFRQEYIPILRLRELFALSQADESALPELLVVVEGGGQQVGLLVDDLLGQQQVVIKSLETNFQRVEGLSGATILGDGSVALILDVMGLIQLGRQRCVQPTPT